MRSKNINEFGSFEALLFFLNSVDYMYDFIQYLKIYIINI